MTLGDQLMEGLQGLEARGLLRTPGPSVPWDSVIDGCTNDYLGYGARPLDSAELDRVAGAFAGARASRLIDGTHSVHRALEAAVARWVGQPAALTFSSGYSANVGLLQCLAGPHDLIVSDRLNHASIIDGCRLSGARVRVVSHCADRAEMMGALDIPARRRFIVTESYFSMDGDSPDLPMLRGVADDFDASLVVDEAHALGILGPGGAGLCAEAGVKPDVLVGTFSKALGVQGAFVACEEVVRDWLWNSARSFVFSTGLSPVLATLAAERVVRIQADAGLRRRLQSVMCAVADGLKGAGVARIGGSYGPIFPIHLGEADTVLRAAERIRAQGVRVTPIRPPTVPNGTCRLRLTGKAYWSDSDVASVVEAVQQGVSAAL